jgi:hypothetical protein
MGKFSRTDVARTAGLTRAARSIFAPALVLALALFVAPTSTHANPVVATAPAPASDAFGTEASIKPLEVRTRRLHLVRPDLMHYPISYDTYC